MNKRKNKSLNRKIVSSSVSVIVSLSLVLFVLGLLSLFLINAQRLTNYVKENVDFISTYELLSPLLALCFGVPGSKKFKQEVNELIRSRDIQKLEYTYLNLIAA